MRRKKFKKFQKNITDITTSFNFIEDFLKEVNQYEKYKEKFNKWKCLYANQQKSYKEISKMTKEEKQKAEEMINEFYPNAKKIQNAEYFSRAPAGSSPAPEAVPAGTGPSGPDVPGRAGPLS